MEFSHNVLALAQQPPLVLSAHRSELGLLFAFNSLLLVGFVLEELRRGRRVHSVESLAAAKTILVAGPPFEPEAQLVPSLTRLDLPKPASPPTVDSPPAGIHLVKELSVIPPLAAPPGGSEGWSELLARVRGGPQSSVEALKFGDDSAPLPGIEGEEGSPEVSEKTPLSLSTGGSGIDPEPQGAPSCEEPMLPEFVIRSSRIVSLELSKGKSELGPWDTSASS